MSPSENPTERTTTEQEISLFAYDKALAAVSGNAVATKFLEFNKARLLELGTIAGQKALEELIALFAAGHNREAWNVFYGRSASWATLAQGAAEDVANTADLAKRWNELGDYLQATGVAAARALLMILVAGFCG